MSAGPGDVPSTTFPAGLQVHVFDLDWRRHRPAMAAAATAAETIVELAAGWLVGAPPDFLSAPCPNAEENVEQIVHSDRRLPADTVGERLAAAAANATAVADHTGFMHLAPSEVSGIGRPGVWNPHCIRPIIEDKFGIPCCSEHIKGWHQSLLRLVHVLRCVRNQNGSFACTCSKSVYTSSGRGKIQPRNREVENICALEASFDILSVVLCRFCSVVQSAMQVCDTAMLS